MPVYLARVDVHSAVVSSGVWPTGSPGCRLRSGFRADGLGSARTAHHRCRVAVNDLFSDGDRRAAARAALRRAAELGVGTLHELGGPHLGPYADLERVVSAGAELGQHVVTYWGEPATPSLIAEVLADGVRGLAGDLCVDGAIGSRTAWLYEPYADAVPWTDAIRGCAQYLTVEEITDHLTAVHASRAVRRLPLHRRRRGAGRGDRTAAGRGRARRRRRPSRARHRLEHVEMVTPEQIATLRPARGRRAACSRRSTPPGVDPGELYEQRLGRPGARRR